MKYKYIGRLARFLYLTAFLIFSAVQINAEEITIANGTSANDYVPVYGQWGDAAQKCEFIIPAESLSSLTGKNLTSLKFYSNTASHNWEGQFQIFLKEVEPSTLTSFTGPDDALTVYQGAGFQIDANKEMLISFTVPYKYNGGNLLIGLYKEKGGKYKKMSFYGQNQNGITAVSGYSSSGIDAVGPSSRYFIPKTTITYEDAVSTEGASLQIVDFNNGSEFDFGEVPAGTKKIFSLTNPGTSDLSISEITLSGGFTFVEGNETKVIEPSKFVSLTIATPEKNAEGELRIVSDDPDGDYVIILKSTLKVPKPQISLNVSALDFGKCKEDASKEITVKNTGDAVLEAEISSSDSHFEVSPAILEIEPGQSDVFTVTFKYDSEYIGEHEAIITVSSNAGDPIEVKAIVNVPDPNVWMEDFEGGEMPRGWSTTGWTVTKLDAYSGGNGTYMAFAGKTSNEYELITPRLYATKGQKLNFTVGTYTDGTDKLYVEYSTDQTEWKAIDGAPLTSGGDHSFTAPDDGYYYLKFRGKYGAVDNFEGFKLALKEHDLSFSSENIPDAGHQYVAYTANVSVTEMMDKDEDITAYLYFGDEVMAEESLTLSAGATQTISLSFVPQTGYAEVPAKVVVTYAEGEQLVSKSVVVNISEAAVWDEESDNELTEGEYPALVFKYKPTEGWNMISTPFALTEDHLNKIFGDSYMVFELKDYKDGVIKFEESSRCVSGYPYVVYVNNNVSSDEPQSYSADDETSVILEGVKVDQVTPKSDEKNGVKVISNFSMKKADADETIFTIHPVGKTLEKAESVNSFRPYITLDSTVAGTPELKFFDRSGVETGINSISADSPAPKGIFTIQGIRVEEPLEPGLYIIDGKKVLVK